jgi:ribosomal protein L11 methyltransferase
LHYLFKLPENVSEEEATLLLLEKGFTYPYSIEEGGEIILGAFSEEEREAPLELIKKEMTPSIDWEKEWQSHAPHFADGVQSLTLPNGKILELLPGAGFGDYSHPTTQLCLNKLSLYIKDQMVVDIGSGSGILMLASRLLGAPKAIGVEIDPLAIEHSKLNQAHNNITNISFDLKEARGPLLIVINMIRSEQMALFKENPNILLLKGIWIISGLLIEERGIYLDFLLSKGFTLIEEELKEGWLAFVCNHPT